MSAVAFKHKIYRIIAKALSGFSYMVPKCNNLWVFGAWEGEQYSDNSKYMFEYVVKNHPEIDAVWITRKPEIIKEISELGMTCFDRFSLKGVLSVLRAKIAFETEGNRDISPFLNIKKTMTIQQWHGFPLKAMKWKKEDGTRQMKSAKYYDNYYWISCSDEYTKLMNECLGVDMSRFQLTGYPRDDSFVKCKPNMDVYNFMMNRKDYKFVIYMPTHRNFGREGNKYINYDTFLQLDEMLQKHNLILVYKPHFHELKNFEGIDNRFKNIHFAKEPYWNDVYSYLHMFDALISDYSSVIADYVCSDKPIVIFPYDIDDYKNADAGITSCFYDYPLGPFCFSWQEVIKECNDLIIHDTWKEKRKKYYNVYQSFSDGNNCERVYQYAKNLSSL